MSITQKFHYTWPEGAQQLQFEPWVATLLQAEQDEFAQAKIRQQAYRQPFIDDGRLTVMDNGYKWKDQETADLGKPTDTIWMKYWNRYINETGVAFTTSYS